MPDRNEMRAFIEGILRDMEGNAILSLSTGRTPPTERAPHGKLIVDSHHWFSYPEELELMVDFGMNATAERRDAYISPIIYGDQPFVDKKSNEIIQRTRLDRPLFSRAKTNALFSQTIYMDSDACPPEAFRLAPSRHVQTSEGHGHDYWYLASPIPASMASEIAHRITTAHKADGSDPSGWSANKVLRLPTFNTTYDELAPHEVTWFESKDAQNGEVYDALDISGAYDDVELDSTTGATPAEREMPPVPPLEGLPDVAELLGRIPKSEKRLNDLIYKVPKEWRSEQRYALLLDLKRYGFTDEETIAIAWGTPAAAKWREDNRGVDGLWWELQVKVKPVLDIESGATLPPSPEPVAGSLRGRAPMELLSDAARARVESRSDMLTLYLEYAKTRVQTPNMPYHIINAWTLMALGLSDSIELPKEPKALGTGIFSITVGKSSSGKDEANNVLQPCVNELFANDSPYVAAQSSREALIESLMDRHDKVTYIDENEADALIMAVKSGSGPMLGVDRFWTRAYDGEVPGLGRVGKKELNQGGRHAIVTMRFMGTPVGILSVLDHKMFKSGWLARQIWVIGDEVVATQESMRSKFRRGDASTARDFMPKYLAMQLAIIRARMRSRAPFDKKRAELDPTDEAIELVDKAKWDLYQVVEHDGLDLQIFGPILRRMGDIIWKIAGLSAAMNNRQVVTSRDAEVALYYVETWMSNSITISDGISETYFSQQTDEIEKFIAGSPDRKADAGMIYRFRKREDSRVTDTYINSLLRQSRIVALEGNIYAIKERNAS